MAVINTILTRDQFSDVFNGHQPGMGESDSPLWIPEKVVDIGQNAIRCNWFLCIPSIRIDRRKDEFWEWCNEMLVGQCRCFSSSPNEEWWGFTDERDVLIWALKWT